ncbi:MULTISPECIES: hypothetical protein [unclassified Streptomyces]|uniref:hypothetical protein n=1 Tax=unclassified Streptomyces TaxID=2593676 RepID=UPI000DB9CB79|nr:MULTISPECIES: hypothetical protein [unclassified Streptomyces]MYT69180.1 hypothetical protein [Streptomyces sp. SID8367]RAJ82695.1 hypothetical protein K377_04416 [Streptomyces sp. PsTaAH-137]
MTTSAPRHEPVPDPRALLTELGERVLEREGIPMFLALQVPARDNEQTRADAEGEELAGLLRHYRGALVPEAGDDSEPALIEVLQVMGAAHLTPQAPAAQKDENRR